MFGSSRTRAELATATAAAESQGWSRKPPTALRRFLEFFVLSGFVIAQPILDVFGRAGETFVFRRIDRIGVLLFAAVVIFAPPLIMWVLGSAAAWLGDFVGSVAHDAMMGVLWVLLWVEVLQRFETLPPSIVAIAGIVFGAAAVALPVARTAVRLWMMYATPAPIIFGLVFLLISPVSAQVRLSEEVAAKDVAVGNPAPIVLVVLDELPLASLIQQDGQLDADLYPNIAKLQQESHTFLNASSNAWVTHYSVPSMLTGRLPHSQKIPVATTHPNNLFTLFGQSHELRVHELLRLCPDSLCPQDRSDGALARGLGGLVYDGLTTFGQIVDPRSSAADDTSSLLYEASAAMREASEGAPMPLGDVNLRVPDRVTAFLDDVERPTRTGRPPLGFLHLLIPHSPWQLLPDGRQYLVPAGERSQLGLEDSIWNNDGHFVSLARQRHVLQVQYADQLIGELVRQLKQSELWNQSVVVVTADHGASFEAGEPRRDATSRNADELAWVPLFIKEPGQRSGSTSLHNVQLVDVLPTLADILDIDVPWRLDGRSVFDKPRGLSLPRPFFYDGRLMRLNGVQLRREVLDNSIAKFAPLRGDPLRVYRVGSAADLVGRRVSEVPMAGASTSMWARFDVPSLWAEVDKSAPVIPTYAAGHLYDPERTAKSLVVSVNGVVANVSELVGPAEAREFAGLIPPVLLDDGRNDVRVYALDKARRLAPVHSR